MSKGEVCMYLLFTTLVGGSQAGILTEYLSNGVICCYVQKRAPNTRPAGLSFTGSRKAFGS